MFGQKDGKINVLKDQMYLIRNLDLIYLTF